MTYTSPKLPPGTLNVLFRSGRVRRSFHTDKTVKTVVADRSQMYMEINSAKFCQAKSA